MTSIQTIKLTVLLMTIICLVFGYIYNGASASDMDCFNYSISQAQYKSALNIRDKIKAYKAVKSLKALCKSDY